MVNKSNNIFAISRQAIQEGKGKGKEFSRTGQPMVYEIIIAILVLLL